MSKYSGLHVYSAFDAHCNMNCLKSPTFTEPFVCFSSSFPNPSSVRTFMACKAPSLFPLCLNFLSLRSAESQAKSLIGSTSRWHASFCLVTWPWDITRAHNHSSCRECCLMWWYFLLEYIARKVSVTSILLIEMSYLVQSASALCLIHPAPCNVW